MQRRRWFVTACHEVRDGMSSTDRLAEYHARRDLARSGESGAGTHGSATAPSFVVQRHDATSLHFDFRLEIGDALVSWSVPKGPSTDPREKRLALRTEDHPLDYVDFEGHIPEDEYGGGTVVVWDTGTFDNLDEHSLAHALDLGHLRVSLYGRKISGPYSLLHTRMNSSPERQQWLLVKKNDVGADRRHNSARTQPESVLTGKYNEDFRP